MIPVLLVLLPVVILLVLLLLPGWIERGLNKRAGGVPAQPVSQEAGNLHQRLFVADLHADSLLWARDLRKESRRGHVDLPRLDQGNVGLQVFAAVTKVPRDQNFDCTDGSSDVLPALSFLQRWPRRTWGSQLERALHQAARLHTLEAQSGGSLVIVKRRADLQRVIDERAAGTRTLGAMLLLEGVHALNSDLGNVARIESAGFRIVGLAHFFDNDAVGSAHGVRKHGLTDYGADLVCELERWGLMIDLAHASRQTIDDVLRITSRPMLVSHTGVNVRGEHPRNLDCGQACEIVRRGGLLGVAFFEEVTGGLSIDAIANCICETAEAVGIQGVALGSDFDGAIIAPLHVGEMSRITEALMDRGLNEAEIAQIMGGNAVRFLERALR